MFVNKFFFKPIKWIFDEFIGTTTNDNNKGGNLNVQYRIEYYKDYIKNNYIPLRCSDKQTICLQ